MKKRKNKIPAFIPNRPDRSFVTEHDFILDEGGKRNEIELRKQRENQKKLMLNNKNHKY